MIRLKCPYKNEKAKKYKKRWGELGWNGQINYPLSRSYNRSAQLLLKYRFFIWGGFKFIFGEKKKSGKIIILDLVYKFISLLLSNVFYSLEYPEKANQRRLVIFLIMSHESWEEFSCTPVRWIFHHVSSRKVLLLPTHTTWGNHINYKMMQWIEQ